MTTRVFYPQARAILQVVFDGFGPTSKDTDPVIFAVLPTAVSIQRNSYRQPDAWELTFEASDLPIDPQQIRAGSAEIFLFDTGGIGPDTQVLSRQYTQADDPGVQTGRTPGDSAALEAEMRQAQRKFTLGNKPRIAGTFDDVSLEYSSSGKFVTISGQDYTLFLKGRQWPPKSTSIFRGKVSKSGKVTGGKKIGKLVGVPRRIPTGKRLDTLLEGILAEADPSGRLSLLVENIERKDLPVVGANETRGNQRGIPIQEQTSYWDVMYKLATRYGMIMFVRGLDVVLTRPKNITSTATTDLRQLYWGNNIESLRMSRSLGKEKVPRIVVKGYDPKTHNTVTEVFPENDQLTPVGTLGVEQDEYQIVPVYGVSDRRILRQVAENLFNVIGGAERKTVITTRDLRDTRDKNLLDLEPGDAVDVEWVDFNKEVLANANVSEQAKYEHLISRGFSPEVAQTIAKNYNTLFATKRPMRVREVSFDYSVSDGVTIEAELTDFIVIDGMREQANKTSRKAGLKTRVVKGDGTPIGNPILDAQSVRR